MNIQWTVPSVDDLTSIHDFIARDSSFYASSFVEKILNTVEMLEKFPQIGREVPEADNPDIRELLFQNYRIMYRVSPDLIQIIAVLRGSRDIAKWPLKPWEII